MSNVTRYGDMPSEQHWAIVTYSSVYIPGDERSRTNPGHGYPASTENIVRYKTYTDQREWEEQIRRYEETKTQYSAMLVTPVKVSTNVTVTIGE